MLISNQVLAHKEGDDLLDDLLAVAKRIFGLEPRRT